MHWGNPKNPDFEAAGNLSILPDRPSRLFVLGTKAQHGYNPCAKCDRETKGRRGTGGIEAKRVPGDAVWECAPGG